MSKPYDLSKKSDLRKLSNDIDKALYDIAYDHLENEEFALACPHCNCEITVHNGLNTCENCNSEIEVSLEFPE